MWVSVKFSEDSGVVRQVCVSLGMKIVDKLDWVIHCVCRPIADYFCGKEMRITASSLHCFLVKHSTSCISCEHVWMKSYLSWTQAHVSTTAFVSLVCLPFSRLYHAERLPKTNLVFIVAETEHGCECQEKILKQEEQECILLLNTSYNLVDSVYTWLREQMFIKFVLWRT